VRPAYADEVGSICQINQEHPPIELLSAWSCTGFRRGATTTEFGFAGSGHLIASPDGHEVVFIHDFPMGNPDEQTAPAIAFFTADKPPVSYSFRQILRLFDLVTFSVSHFHWLANADILNTPLGAKFPIRTTSWREMTFDVRTATLESDRTVIDGCQVVVFGEIEELKGTYRIVHPQFVKGHVRPPILFKLPSSLPVDEEQALPPAEGVEIGPGGSSSHVRINQHAAVCLRTVAEHFEATRVLVECEIYGERRSCRPVLLNAIGTRVWW